MLVFVVPAPVVIFYSIVTPILDIWHEKYDVRDSTDPATCGCSSTAFYVTRESWEGARMLDWLSSRRSLAECLQGPTTTNDCRTTYLEAWGAEVGLRAPADQQLAIGLYRRAFERSLADNPSRPGWAAVSALWKLSGDLELVSKLPDNVVFLPGLPATPCSG